MRIHQQLSPYQAGEACRFHHAIIVLDFDVGLREEQMLNKGIPTNHERIKAMRNRNETYSLHRARNSRELVKTALEIAKGGGRQATDKILLSVGNHLVPLKDQIIKHDFVSRTALYKNLCDLGNHGYRFGYKTGRHQDYVEALTPKIALFVPDSASQQNTRLSEKFELESHPFRTSLTDQIHFPKGSGTETESVTEPCMIIGLPCIYFPHQFRNRQDFERSKDSEDRIIWLVKGQDNFANASNYNALIKAMTEPSQKPVIPNLTQ